MIGGFIGSFPFFTLEGNLSPQGVILENQSEPCEHGELIVQMGRHGPVATLVGGVDLLEASFVPQQLFQYSLIVGFAVLVQFRRGNTFVPYANWTVMSAPEDITEEEEEFVETVSGGVYGGQYWLRTRWTLQYLLPF